MISRNHVIIHILNMEQERLQLIMKCEQLASHQRCLEAALKFCHSHSLVMSLEYQPTTGATPTHQLQRKLSKATQVIIELVNQKEQLLSIVSKLRDKLKSNEQKIESPRSKSGSRDANLCDKVARDPTSRMPFIGVGLEIQTIGCSYVYRMLI